MFGKKDDERPTSRGALLIAVAVSVIVGVFVPFGGVLLYPFTLLATWVHEMGHGLTALALGGRFDHLEIFGDASGLAHTSNAGGRVDARDRPRPAGAQVILVALGLALLASLILWVRSVAGLVAVPLVAAVLVLFTWWGSPRERMFLAQFIGLRLALDTMGRGMDYLFTDSAMVGGVKRASDIARVAEGFGGPRFLWSGVIASVCIGFVAIGLVAAWRPHRRTLTRTCPVPGAT
jgi:hypothetical protein